MQYTNKIHGTNKLIWQITKCFKMLVNLPFNRISTTILWNIIKLTKSRIFTPKLTCNLESFTYYRPATYAWLWHELSLENGRCVDGNKQVLECYKCKRCVLDKMDGFVKRHNYLLKLPYPSPILDSWRARTCKSPVLCCWNWKLYTCVQHRYVYKIPAVGYLFSVSDTEIYSVVLWRIIRRSSMART